MPGVARTLFSEYRIRGQKLPRRRGAGVLAPMKKDLPPEVFTQIYQPRYPKAMATIVTTC